MNIEIWLLCNHVACNNMYILATVMGTLDEVPMGKVQQNGTTWLVNSHKLDSMFSNENHLKPIWGGICMTSFWREIQLV
jgi:hypothetical protein